MGGFIMVCTTFLGHYAAQQDMNVQYMCYFGIMSFINGILDLVKCIDWMVKVSGLMPIFSSKMPFVHNVMSFTMIACPVVSLIGAWMAYIVYKDYTSLAPAPMDDDRDFGGGAGRPIMPSQPRQSRRG